MLTIVLTVRLYDVVPKGFMPLQDTGILVGSTHGLARHFLHRDGGPPARGGGRAAGRSGGRDGVELEVGVGQRLVVDEPRLD